MNMCSYFLYWVTTKALEYTMGWAPACLCCVSGMFATIEEWEAFSLGLPAYTHSYMGP